MIPIVIFISEKSKNLRLAMSPVFTLFSRILEIINLLNNLIILKWLKLIMLANTESMASIFLILALCCVLQTLNSAVKSINHHNFIDFIDKYSFIALQLDYDSPVSYIVMKSLDWMSCPSRIPNEKNGRENGIAVDCSIKWFVWLVL